MKKVLVLGAGMVGSVLARDLARTDGLDVTVADAREEALARAAAGVALRTVRADLADPKAVAARAAGFDLVAGALPGFLGLQTLRAVLEAGVDVVDISFMPENALALDALARERGVTAVFDMGVAPGMSHLLAGLAAARFEALDRVEIRVGGLPAEGKPPFRYKAPFSPSDVIEEYTRPARLKEAGRIVTVPALSGVEPFAFPGLEPLEAFCTDGLRSLLETLDAPDMVEKTVRYPGHAELMRAFRDAGFFGVDPVEVGGVPLKPLALAERLLFPLWRYEEGEADFTVMRVEAFGRAEGAARRLSWDLLDRHDPAANESSMARTTAFPAAAAARLLAAGKLPGPGVFAPEQLGGRDDLVGAILADLAERGVRFVERNEKV